PNHKPAKPNPGQEAVKQIPLTSLERGQLQSEFPAGKIQSRRMKTPLRKGKSSTRRNAAFAMAPRAKETVAWPGFLTSALPISRIRTCGNRLMERSAGKSAKARWRCPLFV